MDIKGVYKQLTNVDIEQQKELWDERGKGYYGEYLVFCELYKHVEGNCKILMNLNIPVNDSKTTEIDLLLIHETGLYVFEIKHYKGVIYGKDTDNLWTQYFRTAPNHTFTNPIKQNEYHLNALRKKFPHLDFRSVIVFTSDECNVKISNANTEVDVCALYDIDKILSHRFNRHKSIFSQIDIDNIFVELKEFSQMKTPVEIDGTSKDFLSWVQPTINLLNSKKSELDKEKSKLEKMYKSLKTAKYKGWAVNAAVAAVCIMVALFFVFSSQKFYDLKIQENNAELAKFKQNFLHIDEIDNEYIDSLATYVKVSDVVLEKLTEDAVSFSASLSMLNETYGLVIQNDAKYIVMTESGKIYEYDLFGESVAYNSWKNKLGKPYNKSVNLSDTQFYGIIDPNDVTYIKLKNVQLTKTDTSTTVIKDGLEVELYTKQ